MKVYSGREGTNYYYRPKIGQLPLQESERTYVSRIQNVYDMLEGVKETEYPNYDPRLEEGSRAQIEEVNKQLENLANIYTKYGGNLEQQPGAVIGGQTEWEQGVSALRLTTSGIPVWHPEWQDKSVKAHSEWRNEYGVDNPTNKLLINYTGWQPKESSSLLKNLAIGALGMIPGIGIPLATTVGAIESGFKQDTDIGDWLKGGATGALAGLGGQAVGGALGNILAPAAIPGLGAGGVGPLGQYAAGGSALVGGTAVPAATSWVPGAIAGATSAGAGAIPDLSQMISRGITPTTQGGTMPFDMLQQLGLNYQGSPLSVQDILGRENLWQVPTTGIPGVTDWLGMLGGGPEAGGGLLGGQDILGQLQTIGTLGGDVGGINWLQQLKNILSGRPAQPQPTGEGASWTDILQQLLGGQPAGTQAGWMDVLQNIMPALISGMGALTAKVPEAPAAPPAYQMPDWAGGMAEEIMDFMRGRLGEGVTPPPVWEQAGTALQNILGMPAAQIQYPVQEQLAAARGLGDIETQRWMEAVKPTIAGAGQLDSTYWAGMQGRQQQEQAAQLQALQAQLLQQQAQENLATQRWWPQMQAGVAGQLAGLGGQQAALDLQNIQLPWQTYFPGMTDWYTQALRQGALEAQPGQQQYGLELQRYLGQLQGRQTAQEAFGTELANIFKTPTIFRPQWNLGGLLS